VKTCLNTVAANEILVLGESIVLKMQARVRSCTDIFKPNIWNSHISLVFIPLHRLCILKTLVNILSLPDPGYYLLPCFIVIAPQMWRICGPPAPDVLYLLYLVFGKPFRRADGLPSTIGFSCNTVSLVSTIP
jgi:hypothetical protein